MDGLCRGLESSVATDVYMNLGPHQRIIMLSSCSLTFRLPGSRAHVHFRSDHMKKSMMSTYLVAAGDDDEPIDLQLHYYLCYIATYSIFIKSSACVMGFKIHDVLTWLII